MYASLLLYNQTIDTILTFSIIFLLVGLFFLNNLIIDKRNLNVTKKFMIGLYLLYFILLLVGIYGIIMIWGFDLNNIDYTLLIDEIAAKGVSIVATVFVFVIGFFIIKISKISILRIINHNGFLQKRKKTIAKISLSLIRYTVWTIGIVIFLAVWGVNVVPVVAGLGILGLVIGLGAQKFINDMISGFFIVIEHHYDIGDIIEVKGFKGEVTDIGLKTTKIRNWLGEVKILNNGDVNDITNFSINNSTAVVEFSIGYKENADEIIELIKSKMPEFRLLHEVITEDPVVLGITSLGPSSVNITVIAKTKSEKQYAVNRDLRRFLKKTLDENNIEIPFPQVVVHQDK